MHHWDGSLTNCQYTESLCVGQPHLLQKRSPEGVLASQSGFTQVGSSKGSPQWGQNWASSDTSLPQPLHSSTPVGLFGGLRETVGASRSGGPVSEAFAEVAGFRAKALTLLTIQSMPAPTSPPIRAPTIATPKIGTDPPYSPPNRAQMVQATPMPPPATAKRIVKSSVSLFNYGLAAGWAEVKVRVQPCSAVSAVHSNEDTRATSGGYQSDIWGDTRATSGGSDVAPAPPSGMGAERLTESERSLLSSSRHS
jgi:hypothetical protein